MTAPSVLLPMIAEGDPMVAIPIFELARNAIDTQRDALAQHLVAREFDRHPELEERYGAAGRAKSLQDAGYHLSYLAQALALNSPTAFADYVAWAKIVLCQRNVLASDLAFHLECLTEVLLEQLPGPPGIVASAYVAEARRAMPGMPEDLPTFLAEGAPLSPLAHQYFEALRRGERHVASQLVLEAVASGTSVKDLYLHVFQTAQREIGRLWQVNRITVAQEHYCTAATQLIMSQLYSHIFASTKNGRTLVATSVSGDLHEIGVRMVADFFEMDGWSTYFLGSSTPHEGVIATLVERKADVLAISATIATHLDAVRELIATVRATPGTHHVRVLVGGYPFNRNVELWRQVGADGSAPDAAGAIALANTLLQAIAR